MTLPLKNYMPARAKQYDKMVRPVLGMRSAAILEPVEAVILRVAPEVATGLPGER